MTVTLDTDRRIALPHSDRPVVSIVVAAASNAVLLAECLASIAATVDHEFPLETIVVRSDADAEVVRLLDRRVDGARIQRSRVKLGFGAACNLGASYVRGDFILILHDDTRLEPGWLEPLLATARDNADAGAVGPKILSPDGSLQSCGCVLHADGSTELRRDEFSEARAVDYCSSSALLVKRATWERVGGFDERFHPAYYNDADLAMSIRHMGQQVLCDPRSVVVHRRGASMDLDLREFAAGRNRERLLAKWSNRPGRPESPDPELGPHEQRALLADIQLKSAYIDELQAKLDVARFERGFAERQRHEIDRLEDEVEGLREQTRWLHQRSTKLGAIENGRWWRLREWLRRSRG